MYRTHRRSLLNQVARGRAAETLPWHVRADAIPGARRLGDIINKVGANEAEFDYRDRMPESFNYDWADIITSASGGQINGVALDARFQDNGGAQVAIVGAGAAGLCAGYEMMKLGLQPIFFEIQTENNPANNATFVRPQGRGYSWDFTCDGTFNGVGGGGAYTSWFPAVVDGPDPTSDNLPVFSGGRQFTDLGAMRYPESHVALHTYVDTIFKGDYYYGELWESQPTPTQWPEWRDPGLFESVSSGPNPYGKPDNSDALVFPTVMYTTGISDSQNLEASYRGFYRMDPGLTLGDANGAVNNLTFKNWNLLFGPDGDGPGGGEGYLRPIVTDYIAYTEAANAGNEVAMKQFEQAITDKWAALNDQFQGQSLYQVLEANGWTQEPAYPSGFDANPANSTLQEMFGEIGIGSGGFDVFWWTTFMETLRIRLHLDETNQDAFVGGTSYMLSPFLTHNATLYDNSTRNLWTQTRNSVITDPVVAIMRDSSGNGVTLTTRAADGTTQQFDFIACILTVSPSAIRTGIDIDEGLMTNQALRTLQRLRLTNSGKIAINLPGIGGYGNAFWMNRNPNNPGDPSNDSIVTTITDENIRSIYTFDNYNWGTQFENPSLVDPLVAGCLMLSYSWDMNSDAFAPLDAEQQVLTAWEQMKEIYSDPSNPNPLPSDVDDYLNWALDNDQYQAIVWTNEKGYSGGYRMAGLGLNQDIEAIGSSGGQTALWDACQTSLNADSGAYTGLFPAGEAIAWLGLSGWIEGAIHTGLASTMGVVNYLNQLDSGIVPPNNSINATSFCLPLLPGDVSFPPPARKAGKAPRRVPAAAK